MNVPLPMFVAVPLVVAFLLPMLPRAGKAIATLLANAATICLLVFAVTSVGQARVYEVGGWSIPLGINMVLDGLKF